MSLDINAIFNKMVNTIEVRGTSLNTEMEKLSDSGTIDESSMLKMQFLVNSYNTMVETASNVCKSLMDEAKNIVQRMS